MIVQLQLLKLCGKTTMGLGPLPMLRLLWLRRPPPVLVIPLQQSAPRDLGQLLQLLQLLQQRPKLLALLVQLYLVTLRKQLQARKPTTTLQMQTSRQQPSQHATARMLKLELELRLGPGLELQPNLGLGLNRMLWPLRTAKRLLGQLLLPELQHGFRIRPRPPPPPCGAFGLACQSSHRRTRTQLRSTGWLGAYPCQCRCPCPCPCPCRCTQLLSRHWTRVLLACNTLMPLRRSKCRWARHK